VTRADCKAFFKTAEHVPPHALRAVYDRIQELVQKDVLEPAESQRLKDMNLSMLGSWLKRSSLKWRVTRRSGRGQSSK
jgi:hypothetical protein